MPGYEAYVWMGLLAPKGTPRADRRPAPSRARRRCWRPTEVKTYMATAGIEIVGSTPAEFGRFFRAEKRPLGESRPRDRREDRLIDGRTR